MVVTAVESHAAAVDEASMLAVSVGADPTGEGVAEAILTRASSLCLFDQAEAVAGAEGTVGGLSAVTQHNL
jgi:hypothetical protein